LPPLDTWTVPPARGANGHKAAFSEELISIAIISTCPPNGVVLDPYAGSGTTLQFAKKNGFRAIGVDIKKEYCELMKQACIATSRGHSFISGACAGEPCTNGKNGSRSRLGD